MNFMGKSSKHPPHEEYIIDIELSSPKEYTYEQIYEIAREIALKPLPIYPLPLPIAKWVDTCLSWKLNINMIFLQGCRYLDWQAPLQPNGQPRSYWACKYYNTYGKKPGAEEKMKELDDGLSVG